MNTDLNLEKATSAELQRALDEVNAERDRLSVVAHQLVDLVALRRQQEQAAAADAAAELAASAEAERVAGLEADRRALAAKKGAGSTGEGR